MESLVTPSFWKDKKIFLTGHTGFKGSWMSHLLLKFGAKVFGYSIPPQTNPNLYELAGLERRLSSTISDIRDFKKLWASFNEIKPEIVIHMAAQPIVRDGYSDPRYTYETNVMGTVNLLECLRLSNSVKSFLNITTDKVYKNNEWEWGYREIDPLDGYDPYSNSKSCSELATHSYKNSFFADRNVAISTARSGNVIGGGDFSNERIIPDCIRAIQENKSIIVRNPHSIRPYQHVLEPLMAYLMITEKQYANPCKYADYYNIGPDEQDCVTTGQLVDIFCSEWGKDAEWESKKLDGPHEAAFLKLDSSKIKSRFGWKPKWNVPEAVQKTCEWTKAWIKGDSVLKVMDRQIDDYMRGSQDEE